MINVMVMLRMTMMVSLYLVLAYVIGRSIWCDASFHEDCFNLLSSIFNSDTCVLARSGACEDGNLPLNGTLLLILKGMRIVSVLLVPLAAHVFVIYVNGEDFDLTELVFQLVPKVYVMFMVMFYASSFFSQYIVPVPADEIATVSCHEVSTYHFNCQMLGFMIVLVLPMALRTSYFVVQSAFRGES